MSTRSPRSCNYQGTGLIVGVRNTSSLPLVESWVGLPEVEEWKIRSERENENAGRPSGIRGMQNSAGADEDVGA